MKQFHWNEDKNRLLKASRNISFEEVVQAIKDGKLIETKTHPNQLKYPGQKIFLVEIDNYIYTIPFVEDSQVVFMKTIYPDRILTKKYLGEQNV